MCSQNIVLQGKVLDQKTGFIGFDIKKKSGQFVCLTLQKTRFLISIIPPYVLEQTKFSSQKFQFRK